jgi:hypothetical protein
MGMFDDIHVPKSYLRSLLTKKQEKVIEGNSYQTKCLDNTLFQYKVYKQKLFLKSGLLKGKTKWVRHEHTGDIIFYNSFEDKDGNSYWVEFKFFFINGVLDTKELVKFTLESTLKERQEAKKKFKERLEKIKVFESSFKFKIFKGLENLFLELCSWAQYHTSIHEKNEKVRLKKISPFRFVIIKILLPIVVIFTLLKATLLISVNPLNVFVIAPVLIFIIFLLLKYGVLDKDV